MRAPDVTVISEGKVLDIVIPTAFEDVEETGDVAVDVRLRIGQRVPHARLGGEMHDTSTYAIFFSRNEYARFNAK